MQDLPGALRRTAQHLIPQQESLAADRRDDLSGDGVALSLDLVSALAGDRPLTDADRHLVEELRVARGHLFHSDLLYTVTHQRFAPEAAADLWDNILRHKYEMSSAMCRNIRIAVATLDYLSNLVAELSSPTVISESRIADIVRRSQCDGLTGLFNHACCYQQLDSALLRARGRGTPVSLMMIDIDNFKALNDQYGHQEGDRVLAMAGRAIAAATRSSDVCCRYGGEEFVVILPSTDAPEAGVLAERLRSGVEQSLPGGRAVTVSIGVAACGPQSCTAQDLVRRADAALYRAKAGGRNRVETAT